MEGQRSISPVLAFLLGVAVVGARRAGLSVYERQNREVLKIDVPGFSGEISKDNGASISRSAKTASASDLTWEAADAASRWHARPLPTLGNQHCGAGQLALAQAFKRLVGGG